MDERAISKLYAICEGCISDLLWMKSYFIKGYPRKMPKNYEDDIRCLFKGKCSGQPLRLKQKDREDIISLTTKDNND